MQAMLNIGMASGPWVGPFFSKNFTISPAEGDFQLNGLVLHAFTGTTTATLFVLAIAIALSNLVFVLFIVPESLSLSRRLSHVSSPVVHQSQQYRKGVVHRTLKALRNLASQFLRPAALFIPPKLEARRMRDWNLMLTGAALFLYMFADVSDICVYDA
jgi:MFS family permease